MAADPIPTPDVGASAQEPGSAAVAEPGSAAVAEPGGKGSPDKGTRFLKSGLAMEIGRLSYQLGDLSEKMAEQAEKAALSERKKAALSEQNRQAVRPEVLADLAVKLLQLETRNPANGSCPECARSHPPGKEEYENALKGAKMLLLAASGEGEKKVHAYQLFEEKDGLMSFSAVRERLKEAEWGDIGSLDGFRKHVIGLVDQAQKEVQKQQEKYEAFVLIRRGYPWGLVTFKEQMTNDFEDLIENSQLRDLIEDPGQVAKTMGQVFLRLMENKIWGSWETVLQEEHATAAGFDSFIEYVCGGMTYENFCPDPLHLRVDSERLNCIVFFLEQLMALEGIEYASENLAILMRLVRNTKAILDPAVSDLNGCLVELQTEHPDFTRVRELASSACAAVGEVRDQWKLIAVLRAQNLRKLVSELRDPDSRINSSDLVPDGKVKQVLALLQRANHEAWEDSSMKAGEIRQLIEEMLQNIDSPLITAAMVEARHFEGTIADQFKRMVAGLRSRLQEEPPPNSRAGALDQLLRELTPCDDKKFRPYELFLFAAQKKLLEDRLVRERSKLNIDVRVHPPYPLRLSILEAHKGASIVMESLPEDG